VVNSLVSQDTLYSYFRLPTHTRSIHDITIAFYRLLSVSALSMSLHGYWRYTRLHHHHSIDDGSGGDGGATSGIY